MRNALLIAALVAVSAVACTSPQAEPAAPEEDGNEMPEALSMLGAPLMRPTLSETRRQELGEKLASARAAYEADPGELSRIWLGRRLAYLSRYNDAIAVFTEGLEQAPRSYRLLRHRGHRYITLRRFEDAIADLTRAAELSAEVEDEIEPDGIPNRINRPLSSTKFNIWYHLGLAHYLQGEYESALAAYRECMKVSTNPDLLVATTDWTYMTLRRLGRHPEAAALLEPISAQLEIIENAAYHRRLLMYKGEINPQELLDLRVEDDSDLALNLATQGYGVGNWYLVQGDPETARAIFQRIVEGTSWAAFGYIAAEADLSRMPPLE